MDPTDPADIPATPATRALAGSGLAHRVVRTVRARSAEESAGRHDDEEVVVVAAPHDDYLFVIVPAGRRFDWPKLRDHLGVRRMTLPDADEARAVTGYERYTITPFGSTRAWPVILDAAALGHDVVAIGGGGFGVNIHLSPVDLVAHLGAAVVDVSVDEPATE
jgi:Cys-tRNA(Pro)/Cys-tRNA(Cys) deacylase